MTLMWLAVMVAVLGVTVNGQQSCTTPDRRPGRCISIRNCPEHLDLLRRIQSGTAGPNALSILRSFICDLSNDTPRVCCANTPDPELITLRSVVNPNPGEPLLPANCGTSVLGDRIFGGDDAPLLAWPWLALLRRRVSAGSTFSCGGVLISKNYVLTAAHCVHSSSGATLDFVRIGEHTLSTNPDCENNICADPPQDIRVAEIKVHEGYNPNSPTCRFCHDIALLRLETPAILHDLYVVPICLPRNLETDLGIVNHNYTSKNGWVAGFGTVDRVRVIQPDVLQEALLPINKQFCDISSYPDPNMVICAGGENVDSCRGDSGGPITINNAKNTRVFLLGVVSQGPVICGAARTQGIYTSINYYIDWILRTLRP